MNERERSEAKPTRRVRRMRDAYIRMLLCAGSLAFCVQAIAYASQANVYIAQTAQGSADGFSCANAKAVSFFNTVSNWGTGATQIGPGTTVHLCGTFNAPAGASGYLAFQANGAVGNVIILRFEPDAILLAPFWGPNGAVYTTHDYNVIDGGTNGAIRATDNGTALTYHVAGTGTAGVVSYGGSYNEIKNLAVENIYVHTSNLADTVSGTEAWCVYVRGGSGNSVHHNTLHDCGAAIRFAYVTDVGFTAYNNTIYNINWGIIVGDSNPNSTLTGIVTVHNNEIYNFNMWDQTNNNNHHDGIYFFTTNSGSSFHGGQIYNNWIHGNPGVYMNAMIFISDLPHSCGGHYVYNNLLVNESASTVNTPSNGLIQDWCDGDFIYNNTLVGITQNSTNPLNNSNPGLNINLGTNATIQNNIFVLFRNGIGMGSGSGSILAADNNTFYNNSSLAWDNVNTNYNTLAAWQGCHTHGCPAGSHDMNSINANPNLSASFVPNSGSPVIGAGANLTSLGLTALNSDKAGVVHPVSGPWDIGAYQYVGVSILYGDVSENGSVSAYDASLASQYAVGLITLTSIQITKADVSGNGSVTAYDASLIAQYAVGLITKFPAG